MRIFQRRITCLKTTSASRPFQAVAAVFVIFFVLSGCAKEIVAPQALDDQSKNQAHSAAGRDPEGPIPAPQIPPELAAEAARGEGARPPRLQRVSYEVECEAPDDPRLCALFKEAGRIYAMIDQPARGEPALEQRLRISMDEAQDLLHSLGYYDGQAEGSYEMTPGGAAAARNNAGNASELNALVKIRFSPGPLYHVGESKVFHTPESVSPPAEVEKSLPKNLEDLGLAKNAPAEAEAILAAVNLADDSYREHGYPFAEIASSRYYLEPERKVLDAETEVAAGPFVRMGALKIVGDVSVSLHFLESQSTWKEGRPWQQSLLSQYSESLRQSGLFGSIDLKPGPPKEGSDERDVELSLTPGPERSIGGALKYDSDFGLGAQFSWEHRNFSGRGDKFRVEAPVWQDLQQVALSYRLPYFGRRDQDFVAGGGFIHQDTDAYKMEAFLASAGLNRRFTRHFNAALKGSLEGGYNHDPGMSRVSYYIWGVPLELNFDDADSLLNATKGLRLMASLAPYNGSYESAFNIFRSRVEGQFFLPISRDRFVLALRGVWGMVFGVDDAMDIPPSARFYAGGGGSVRGYEYQSLGPRNANDDPLGGMSQIEGSAEARLRFGSDWGAAAFVDAGTVYPDALASFGQNLYWGAGLGGRYYTAIGPVRFDLAFPLTPRDGDSSYQVYISIGQSF